MWFSSQEYLDSSFGNLSKVQIDGVKDTLPSNMEPWHIEFFFFLAGGACESSRNGKVTLTFPLTHLPWTQNLHVRDDFPMSGAKSILVSKGTETLRRI